MHDKDTQLMIRVANGDIKAFEKLVKRHESSVLNTIYRFIGDRTEAEDLAQEAFLRLYNHASSYKPKAKFSTYLYRIVTNLCLNYLRKRGDVPTDDLDNISSGAPSPSTLLERAETDMAIRRAIDSLPPNQRMAVILRLYDGLSYRDVSATMGCSVAAVESLLFRARQNLKVSLLPYVVE